MQLEYIATRCDRACRVSLAAVASAQALPSLRPPGIGCRNSQQCDALDLSPSNGSCKTLG